jgi:hypothetical protein
LEFTSPRKTAARASLTTTGATNDRTIRHAGGPGTIYAWGPGTVHSDTVWRATTAPKKRRTWLIVLLVILAVMLVGIVGCAALVSTAGKAIDEVSTETSQSQQAEVDRNAPREVTPGKAFTVGKHQTLAGWKVEQENFGDGSNVSGKVKNVSDQTSTAFIHFKFIDKSGEVLGNVDCNSGDLEPGQTQALNCIPNGKYGNYTKVTAEATF